MVDKVINVSDSGCLIDYEEVKLFKEANDIAADSEGIFCNPSISIFDGRYNLYPSGISDMEEDNVFTASGSATASKSTDYVLTGTYSYKLSSPTSSWSNMATLNYPVTISPGETIFFDYAIYSSGSKVIGITTSEDLLYQTSEVKEGWNRYSSRIYNPYSTDKTIYLKFHKFDGTIYIDSVRALLRTQIEKNKNLIDINFATGTDYFERLTHPVALDYETPESSTEESFSGTRSIKFDCSTLGDGGYLEYYENAPFNPNSNYVLSGKIKGENGLKFYISGEICGGNWPEWYNTCNGEWQDFTLVFTTPESIESHYIMLMIEENWQNTVPGIVYIDQMQLETGDTPTEWVSPLPITETDSLSLYNRFAVPDTGAIAEAFSLHNSFKLDENGCLIDYQELHISTDVTDSANHNDNINIQNNLITSDIVTDNELLSLQNYLNVLDSGSIGEMFNLKNSFGLSDNALGNDIPLLIYNQLGLSDNALGNDTLSSLLVMLSLTDSNISVNETISLFNRLPIVDSGFANELPNLKNSFTLDERLVGAADIYPIHNFLGVLESNTILESLHIALETIVDDDGLSNDLVEVFVQMMLLESALGNDDIALTVYTLLSDYGSASETVRKELIKVIGSLIFMKQKNIELEFTNEKTLDVER